MLERDEPIASIIQEALEGFASGRFQSQSEVKRYLDSKPEFPKTGNTNEVKFDRITALLTRLTYAGYLQMEDWGVPLTKGVHEPLISYETYIINQDRLVEKQVAPARKGIDQDFPLRGFLICEACGYRLTACWSKSRTGRKYPYYLCHHKNCVDSRKSISRDLVEREFEAILKNVEPDQQTVEIGKRMFRDAWDKRTESRSTEVVRIRSQAKKVRNEVDELLSRVVRTKSELTVRAYETRICELQSELILFTEEEQKLLSPIADFDKLFELSMNFMAKPYNIWANGSPSVKKTVLRLVFARPLAYRRGVGIRTGETSFPFKALEFLKTSGCKMVPRGGFEPPTRGFSIHCSTPELPGHRDGRIHRVSAF
jgi:site-specific DNA recombinase